MEAMGIKTLTLGLVVKPDSIAFGTTNIYVYSVVHSAINLCS